MAIVAHFVRLILVLILLLVASSAVTSDVVSVAASTKGTLFDQAGTAIAKVATNDGGLQSTLRNYTSANIYIPAVERGQVDFGIASQYEILLALTGQGHFKGRQQPRMRAVAVLFPISVATFVRIDSPVTRIAHLDGRHMPDGYVANKIILPVIDAMLASDGLSRTNLVALNVPGLISGADAFIGGRTDGFPMALRAPKVREANARHGIRALPIYNTPEALAAIRQHLPVAYLTLEHPAPENPGVVEPTWVITYDAVLFASTDTGMDTVYRMTEALARHKRELIAASPAFRQFEIGLMAKDLGAIRYHDGAIRYYQEQGLWPPTGP